MPRWRAFQVHLVAEVHDAGGELPDGPFTEWSEGLEMNVDRERKPVDEVNWRRDRGSSVDISGHGLSGDSLWAKGDLNPHVLADTGT